MRKVRHCTASDATATKHTVHNRFTQGGHYALHFTSTGALRRFLTLSAWGTR